MDDKWQCPSCECWFEWEDQHEVGSIECRSKRCVKCYLCAAYEKETWIELEMPDPPDTTYTSCPECNAHIVLRLEPTIEGAWMIMVEQHGEGTVT